MLREVGAANAPDERALIADLAKAPFRLGEVSKKWRLAVIEWPYLLIAVCAKDGRWFVLRFECTNYPSAPPTACVWEPDRNLQLPFPQWPQSRGGRVGAVFNPNWKDGTALYLPCDRQAIFGHDAWLTTTPALIWRPADGISQYLEIVHELLNCSDYASPAFPAA